MYTTLLFNSITATEYDKYVIVSYHPDLFISTKSTDSLDDFKNEIIYFKAFLNKEIQYYWYNRGRITEATFWELANEFIRRRTLRTLQEKEKG